MKKEILLKRAVVGGFDRAQVIDCIASLQEKAKNAKDESEKLSTLQSTLNELEKILEDKNTEIENLSASVAEMEEKVRVSKTSAQLMKESVDYADRYVESAKILARDITEKTSCKVKDAREKLDSILSEITGLSDDLRNLYTDLTDLRTEYDSFREIYSPALPENYLAEDEGNVVGEESQVCSPSAVQTEPSAPLKDEKDSLEIIRKAKEKYLNMV